MTHLISPLFVVVVGHSCSVAEAEAGLGLVILLPRLPHSGINMPSCSHLLIFHDADSFSTRVSKRMICKLDRPVYCACSTLVIKLIHYAYEQDPPSMTSKFRFLTPSPGVFSALSPTLPTYLHNDTPDLPFTTFIKTSKTPPCIARWETAFPTAQLALTSDSSCILKMSLQF